MRLSKRAHAAQKANILALLSEGLKPREVARLLCLAPSSVHDISSKYKPKKIRPKYDPQFNYPDFGVRTTENVYAWRMGYELSNSGVWNQDNGIENGVIRYPKKKTA